MIRFLSTITFCLLIFFVNCIVSCNKKFDEPPAYVPPDIKPTLTIAQLKSQHITGNVETLNNDDIIEGIVIANDSSGNFYKQIIIEDSTAGIAVNIDDYNLYTAYPKGRKVFIKLKGLYLYDDNNLIELGGGTDATGAINAIEGPLKDNFIIKGNIGNAVIPISVDVTDLSDSFQNMLIELSNFEFNDVDTAKTFADTSSAKNSVNFTLRNCSGKSITLRTSGYASFAGINVPNGNGNITAVLSQYSSTKQLFIRDTSDVQFYNTRCNGSGTGELISIDSLRNMYHGYDTKLGNYKIAGVVISDASAKNISSGSIVLQNGNAGISVYFGGTITYNIGDSIMLDVDGDSLLNYNGSLELKTSYGTIKPTPLATGVAVVPQQLSIAQINSGLHNIEYTLIKITGATATGSIYSGNNILTDASGSITLFTSSTAIFANDTLPHSASSWVGYAKYYGNTPEFQIRNTSDVTTNSVAGDGIELTTSPFKIDFNNIASGLPQGVFVKTSSTSTSLGTDATFTGNNVSWSNSSTGFKNFASATGLNASSDATTQNNSLNRSLGVKQTGTTGYDPGAAFVFELNNFSGKSHLIMNFFLQSLDSSVRRTTTWQVDYGIGDNPLSFTTIKTNTDSLTTGPGFKNEPVTVDFGNGLDNETQKIYIRIVTLTATSGTGSRASSAIDDVQFSWQ